MKKGREGAKLANSPLPAARARPPRPALACPSLARSLAYLLLDPAGSRLWPHHAAPRSYKFRLPRSQAASAATCAAAHSQGQ